MKLNNFIWGEKYRPRKIENLFLPEKVKSTIQNYIESNEVPHFLFYGSPGTSKTTVSKAIVYELGAISLYINGSDETGIDIVRSKIKRFISTKSPNDEKKIVIIDEFDALTINAMQSLKTLMEEFSGNSRFILITNHYHKIIDAIQSRCVKINFNFTDREENKQLVKLYIQRIIEILKKENVKITSENNKKITKVVMDCFPDFRRIINLFQDLSTKNDNDLSNFKYESNVEKIDKLITFLKEGELNELRQYMLNEFQNYEIESLYKEIYRKLTKIIKDKDNVANAIIIISKYKYQEAFVNDKELNIMGMMSELYFEIFKEN